MLSTSPCKVLPLACSYRPDDVWLTDTNDLAIVCELIAKGSVPEAAEVLEAAIEQGTIRLNLNLIARIAQQQAARLHELQVRVYDGVKLPEQNSAAMHFDKNAQLKSFGLTAQTDYIGLAQEKTSGQQIIFKPINRQISRAYAVGYHYLHADRAEERFAFGAFIDSETMPFAWVSYAPVDRKYKRHMLRRANIHPDKTLELTRAWSCDTAPKNTMSLLFAYAHASLQKCWSAQTLELEAVMTAVNPNLGFKGSGFRAVSFGLIGEKPTKFAYKTDRSGQCSFTSRRQLATYAHKRFASFTTDFPLIPTKELALFLRGSSRHRPNVDVYKVSLREYLRC